MGYVQQLFFIKGLKAAGADVTFAVPDRIIDGYGINEHLIDEHIIMELIRLLHVIMELLRLSRLNMLKKKGMTVIVTDHHDIPFDFVDWGKDT